MMPSIECPVSGVALQEIKGELVVSVKVNGIWKTAIKLNYNELINNPEHTSKVSAERFSELGDNKTIDVRPGY